MAKIVTFINQKGGVGKTTSCINMAAYVATYGYKTLVVDLDPQGNASSGLGVSDKNNKLTIYDVLSGRQNITDGVIINTNIGKLDLIPSATKLANAELELSALSMNRERVLSEALDDIRANYDFIFIDCPPSLGLLTINAMTASDSIIIPTQCEFYALEGMSQLLFTIRQIQKYLNPNIYIEGILLTMYDKRSKLTVNVEDEIKKYFPDKLYDITIPRNVRIAEAPSYGLPIVAYDNKCPGAKAYSEVSQEFLRRNNKKIKK